MSKQLAMRLSQGYRKHPVTYACKNCHYLESVLLEGRKKEKHKCRLGGFVVKLGATCDRFSLSGADGNE